MIRPARAGDERTIAALLEEFRDHYGRSHPPVEEIEGSVRRILAGGDGEYLLAFGERDEPVGVAQLRYRWSVWTSAPDCWLEDLFVVDAARGDGHGQALLEAAIERARERGCQRIELDVNEQNESALALYESCGFSREPKPPGRELFMGRPL